MPGDSRLISPRTGDTQCPQPTHDTHNPTPTFEHSIDYSAGQVALVRGAEQEVEHTRSRRSGPRRWLRSVEWLIAAGLHPRANATTLTLAEDLAARMDYDTGHVRYCLDETVARLGISRASVKRHVGYLRELGALAWVQHGTRVNIRRLMGLKGYAATATVYAAVIPPVYDHAMGHRIIGSGYTARIVIDHRGRPAIPAQTRREPVDNPPVENPSLEGLEPPSLTWVKEESQAEVVGGSNYTSQARRAKTRAPHQSSSINGRRRTAADVEKASRTVRLVRALVNWTQSVPLRRLEYVLRPWTDRGWDAMRIADELNGMCAGVRWKPRRPDQFIRARIAQEQAQEQLLREQQAAASPMDNTAWRELMALEALFAEPAPQRTDEDRQYAQTYGWSHWGEVLAHLEEDQDDAIDLYGVRLCQFAISQSARLERTARV
jgi:hypothetical protein